MKKTVAALSGSILALASATPAFASPTIAAIDPCASGQFSNLCKLQAGSVVPTFLTVLLVIAVIIALFFLIWGGIKWIASGGDKGKVESARNTVVAAIVGLIIVFVAWFVIDLVLRMFTGQSISGVLTIPSLK